MGWKIVEQNNKRNEEDEYHYLRNLVQESAVSFATIKSAVSMSKLKSHYSEARLVQLLEDRGIGRPSTFSSLIDKIQQREYVKKEDIKGIQIQCTDFELSRDTNEITKTIISREFGNEKGKLVIQPVGIIVIEFLMKHFDSLFNYEYTNSMETELDKISLGISTLVEICGRCSSLMNTQIQKLNDDGEKKCEIKIDDDHFYIIGKHGPAIKCIDKTTNTISFKPVNKNIDPVKLERGEYTIDDIVKTNNISNSIILGKYKGEDLILKRGKFGLYVSWLTQTKSMAILGNRPIENIGLDEVLEILKKDEIQETSPVNTNIIRNVTDNISIRKGPKGNYIFFKTSKMKRPQFFKLDGFTEDICTCDTTLFKKWIFDTHHIV
jgi:DNA topoisomerase-1